MAQLMSPTAIPLDIIVWENMCVNHIYIPGKGLRVSWDLVKIAYVGGVGILGTWCLLYTRIYMAYVGSQHLVAQVSGAMRIYDIYKIYEIATFTNHAALLLFEFRLAYN